MSGAFTGPLENRPNQSQWVRLLDLALPALDHAFPDERRRLARGDAPRWTLGGGTALALRLGHRVSDDIDVFLSGVRLAELTPYKNPAAKAIGEKCDWPGHFLKFHRPEGEIDFLSSALQTVPGFSIETFRSRVIALETLAEVLTKKIRYRSVQFTPRDTFDFVCVMRAKPEIALTLAAEVGDKLNQVSLALSSLTDDKVRAAIKVDPAFTDILQNPVRLAHEGLERIAHLRDNPIPERIARLIRESVATIDYFEPGSRVGTIRVHWNEAADVSAVEQLALRDAWPEHFREALLSAWRSKDAERFHAWDDHGRPAARTTQRVEKGVDTPDR